MKKIIAIILAAVLVLSFAACKKTDKNPDTTAAADAQTSEQAGDVTGEETASTDETSSETEIVTDKEGHTVVETDAAKPSESKTPSGGSTVTPSKDLNTNDAAPASRLIRRLSPRQSSSRAADRACPSRAR